MQIEDVKKWIRENTRYQVDSYIWANFVQGVGESSLDVIPSNYGDNLAINGKIGLFGFIQADANHEPINLVDFDGLITDAVATFSPSMVRCSYIKETLANKIYFNGYILSLVKQSSVK